MISAYINHACVDYLNCRLCYFLLFSFFGRFLDKMGIFFDNMRSFHFMPYSISIYFVVEMLKIIETMERVFRVDA